MKIEMVGEVQELNERLYIMKCEETCPKGIKNKCCWDCKEVNNCSKDNICKHNQKTCKGKLNE